MRKLTPRETAQAERGCDEVPPTRPCMGGQYRPRKPNAPLRKEVERETDAPEGNLVIVERCARERQRLFSCREYGWDGSVHVLNGTQYGNPASYIQRFPDWSHGWIGTAHVLNSTRYGQPDSP